MAGKKVAVEGDETDHGEGKLKPPSGDNKGTVFVNGKKVIVHLDGGAEAFADNFGHTEEDTKTDGGSSTVFAYKKPVHREDDPRKCGAKTKISRNSDKDKVFAG